MRLFFSSTVYPGDIFDFPDQTAGMPGIEFSGGGQSLSPTGLAERIARLFPEHAGRFLIHNYFPVPKEPFVFNLASREPDTIARSLGLAWAAIGLCRELGVPYYSFHPGFLYEMRPGAPGAYMDYTPDSVQSYSKALERLWNSMETLHAWASEQGIGLLVENLFPRRRGLRTALMISLEEMEETLAGAPSSVGLLLDLGHLNVAATLFDVDPDQYIDGVLKRHEDRIFEIHVSGNNGQWDEHAPLSLGDWQLEALKRFANCPGSQGSGVNVTLEAHRLPFPLLNVQRDLLQEYLQAL